MTQRLYYPLQGTVTRCFAQLSNYLLHLESHLSVPASSWRGDYYTMEEMNEDLKAFVNGFTSIDWNRLTGQIGSCIFSKILYNESNYICAVLNKEKEDHMARESKVETEVRESISTHLAPNETLREYTWGTTEGSISAAYFLFGVLGAALTGQNQPGFFIGLTDRRLILKEVKGKMPTGEVHSISIGDIKGLQYRSSGTTGNLNVHLSADILHLIFDKRPWWPRAKNMAKLMPWQK